MSEELREKVIKGLECCLNTGIFEECTENCPYFTKKLGVGVCSENMKRDALSMLKAQELPDVKPEKLEERTTKWLDQMTAEERLEEIAAILDDWDGYRTAKGLGGLINEVWAYALYPVKVQEPRVMTLDEVINHYSLPPVVLDDLNWQEDYLQDIEPLYFDFPVEDSLLVHWRGYNQARKYINDYKASYGQKWRCWTSRPSDSERRNTSWEN